MPNTSDRADVSAAAPDNCTSTTLWALWEKSFKSLGLAAPVELYSRVFEAWAAPHRRYHTRRHLQDGLDLLSAWFADKPWPAKIALAFFFHDVFYDPMRGDNEERSSRMAHAALLAAGVPLGTVEEICGLIMVTVHSGQPATEDEKVLVDIDLSILGAPESRYLEYTHQVRAEYAAVPDLAFRDGRLRVLLGIFGTHGAKPIFHTERGFRAFDARARVNLSREIEQLRSKGG